MTYLDNAATTRVSRPVAEAMRAALEEDFGNPSSAHAAGLRAARRIKDAQAVLLAALGDHVGAGEVFFTSGGTEADALGVMGAARARRGKHVVITALEHGAVDTSAQILEREGWSVTRVPATRDGLVEPAAIAEAVRPETSVVACMLVQNELGTILPVAEIVRAVRAIKADVHVHCDAVQALGKLPIAVNALGVDSLAVSAHKLHGPKGVGALWRRKGARLQPLWGGKQQQGVRPGTENVPGIVGFATAAQLATPELARVQALADALDAGIGVRGHCAGAPRVPHVRSYGFPGVKAEPLLHALEAQGVMASAGAACNAKAGEKRSGVLAAIDVPPDVGTLRFSFGRESTMADVEALLAALPRALKSIQ